jgi:hypothetical protein
MYIYVSIIGKSQTSVTFFACVRELGGFALLNLAKPPPQMQMGIDPMDVQIGSKNILLFNGWQQKAGNSFLSKFVQPNKYQNPSISVWSLYTFH